MFQMDFAPIFQKESPAISDGAESWDFMQAHYRGISNLPKYIAQYIHATVTIGDDRHV
jgi:hypothetical protein